MAEEDCDKVMTEGVRGRKRIASNFLVKMKQ